MKIKFSLLFALAIMLGTKMEVLAQRHNGDEQGLTIPKGLHLKEDKIALEKAYKGWWKESMQNYEERIAWFKEAKFGCFIHWGVYSALGGVWNGKGTDGYAAHLMRRACIPIPEYKEKVVAPFNPTEFDAEEWMKQVHKTGMKYFIITAKHHDGFAMYNSDAYPFDMRMTSYKGGDIMMELSKAAKKYGIKFGFYYSHAFDWEHPDAPGNDWDFPDHPGGDKQIGGRFWWNERKDFLPIAEKYVREKSIPQIQELVRKYDPDILWFDTPHKLPLYLNIRILEAIREVDPENKIVVNGRLALFGDTNLGDYENTGDRAAFFPNYPMIWEAIPTTNESYAYNAIDKSHKSVSHFVRLISSAASKGGNIMLNVGPMGNGKWDITDVNIFNGIGKWLEVNGESVYNTEKTVLPIPSWGVTTQKGDTLYAHVYDWPANRKLVLGGISKNKIKKAWCITDKDAKIKYKRINASDYELTVPAVMPDTLNTVIALLLKKPVEETSARLLDHTKSNTLYAFDAELIGGGMKYGDGKPNKNYVYGWYSPKQKINWNFRVNKPVTYKVYLDYNTTWYSQNSGTICVEIAGKSFNVDYTPYTEYQGTKTIYVGEVSLPKGESSCMLKGVSYKGRGYLSPIAVRLEKQ